MRTEHGRVGLDAAIELVVERMVAGAGAARSFDPATLGPRHADVPSWRAPVALAASVAVVVVAAAVLWSRPPDTGESAASPALAARPLVVAVSPLQPAMRPARPDAGVPEARVRASSAAARTATTSPAAEMVVAEGGPAPLAVDELLLIPIELPALVVGALHFEDIRIQPLVVPPVEMKE